MNATIWKKRAPEGRGRNMAKKPEDVSDANGIKLLLAWSFVGIPLAWGIYKTLANAVLLFQ
jgi:hypothetical protein